MAAIEAAIVEFLHNVLTTIGWPGVVIIMALVYAITGWVGIFIAAVGTGIGLIPVLFASRRLNCLGILLLPIACNMSGVGHHVAAFLHLV